MSRIVAVVVVLALSFGGRPLHAAQEAEVYTAMQADVDIGFVERAYGDTYAEARARLVANPEVALDRILARVRGTSGLTAIERERLAEVARTISGDGAATQVLAGGPQAVPPAPPSETDDDEVRALSDEVPLAIPDEPPVPPPHASNKRILAGVTAVTGGGLFAGVGALLVVKAGKPADPEDKHPTNPGAAKAVGGTFIAIGALVALAGIFAIARGAREHRARRAWESRKLSLTPTVGRSARGTWTTGLTLRF